MMKKLVVSIAATLFAALPAHAQVAASQVTQGMQVYDGQNQLVGAVSKVENGLATVVTDKHAVPVNPASFALNAGKLYISMTRDELNAFFETNAAAAEQSLAVGKPVKGLEGTTLGTIKEISDAKVVITLTGGQAIELPRNGIAGGATGATVGISAADLAKQLGAASAPAPAATPALAAEVKTSETAK